MWLLHAQSMETIEQLFWEWDKFQDLFNRITVVHLPYPTGNNQDIHYLLRRKGRKQNIWMIPQKTTAALTLWTWWKTRNNWYFQGMHHPATEDIDSTSTKSQNKSNWIIIKKRNKFFILQFGICFICWSFGLPLYRALQRFFR